MQNLVNWFRRQLNNPQVIILAVILIVGFTLVIYAGKMMAPVIASVVIAYILEGAVRIFEAIKVPRLSAVLIVLGLFLILCLALVFGILPLVSSQALQLASQIPSWIAEAGRLHCYSCRIVIRNFFLKPRCAALSARLHSL